jgi:tRNA (adenine-N(1)-)-methyltransferase non-catalytic subunit
VTFESKTEFAQEKYRRRKAKKHVLRVTLRRPRAAQLAEAMFDRGAARLWNLRHDSLAAALSLADVGAHGRVLVVDACQGLVTAACVERMGGCGELVALSAAPGKPPVLDAVRFLNPSAAQRATIRSATLPDLLAAKVCLLVV